MRINYSKTRTKDKDCIVIYSKTRTVFWIGQLIYSDHYVGNLIKKNENRKGYAEFDIYPNLTYEQIDIFYISYKDYMFLNKIVKSWEHAQKLLVYLEEEKL